MVIGRENLQLHDVVTCRFRFSMANALLLELHIGGFSGHGGEAVFPLFVADPRTLRLCNSRGSACGKAFKPGDADGLIGQKWDDRVAVGIRGF